MDFSKYSPNTHILHFLNSFELLFNHTTYVGNEAWYETISLKWGMFYVACDVGDLENMFNSSARVGLLTFEGT